MVENNSVVLLDAWASTFAMRVRIALAEKGIEYESKQENLPDKSDLLLQMNPVHKKIPVLIHNGKAICESLTIVQYIEEMWPEKSPHSLLPSDPYQRSQARFWGDYIDKKIGVNGRTVWRMREEESKVEVMEAMEILESELGDKLFFHGDNFGFVDVALVPYACWFYTFEKIANLSIENKCPKISAWVKRCLEKESVSKILADPQKIYSFVLMIKQRLGFD